MSKPAKKAAGPRKPNPKCAGADGGCDHPGSFHPRDEVKHRRPCKAFGCHCKNFVKPKKETPSE